MISGVEKFFSDNEIIVSKTDLTGRMTYCNDVFIRVSGYSEDECIGKQHSLIRHPAMPRSIFKLLWDTLNNGQEIFAYVVNRCKNGDFYWVNAHVTPSRDSLGNIIGYHSNRRTPDAAIVKNTIEPLYAKLLQIEQSHDNRKEGLAAASAAIRELLSQSGMEYDEFFASLHMEKLDNAA